MFLALAQGGTHVGTSRYTCAHVIFKTSPSLSAHLPTVTVVEVYERAVPDFVVRKVYPSLLVLPQCKSCRNSPPAGARIVRNRRNVELRPA